MRWIVIGKIVNKRRFCVFAILCLLVPVQAASALGFQNPPPNWPWRGIDITGSNWPWHPPIDQNNNPILANYPGGYASPADVDNLVLMGVNAVVLSYDPRQAAIAAGLKPPFTQAQADPIWNAFFAWADPMLDACKRNHIACILALNTFPTYPGLSQDDPGYWNGTEVLQDGTTMLAETVRRMGLVAQHFATRGDELGGYDFQSEPVYGLSPPLVVPPNLLQFQSDEIKAIRQYDQNHYIIITPVLGGLPICYVDNFPNCHASFSVQPPVDPATQKAYPGIVYSSHMYAPGNFTHQGIYPVYDASGNAIPYGSTGNPIVSYPTASPQLDQTYLVSILKSLVDFQRKYGAYVYMGEFSAVRWAPGSDRYVADLINLFDTDGFGWMYFGPGSWNGWDPSYGTLYYSNALYNNFVNVGPDGRPFNGTTPIPQPAGFWIGANSPRWTILKTAFSLNAQKPGNDAFAGRFLLTGSSGKTSGTNVIASKEPGEPNHAGNVGGKSVWWKWVAPAGGQVTLDTHGSSFDTLLAVYTGGSVAALAPVASNDNDGSPNNNSGLVFQAKANTEYEFAVDGFNGAPGSIALNLSLNAAAQADISTNFQQAPNGNSFDYVIVVTNNGPQTATNVVLTVNLAQNLNVKSAPGWTVSGSTLSQTIATLAGGASYSFSFKASPAAIGKATTSASAMSDLPDPNMANNSVSMPATVTAQDITNENDIPMMPPWALASMAMLIAGIGGYVKTR